MRLPRKPQRPCRYPGCGRLSDEPYCEEHRKAARVEYNRYQRPADSNKKYGRAWKRIRDRYATAHPWQWKESVLTIRRMCQAF